ncbi:MAG: aminotransferase class V-fold PLP-dependent enzyme [Cyclobacteriaceae bacterium]
MSNKIYFTPGPSQLFYTAADHLKNAVKEDICSISHRSAEFKKIYEYTIEQLKTLLDLPDEYQIVFASSANEIWERLIQNLTIKKSHHFVNGAFSDKFLSFAHQYGRQSTSESVNDGADFSHWDIPADTELISLTLNETSIGYQITNDEIASVRYANPDKLIALDAVSAFPASKVDINLIDTTYFSVQKCFGLPSGLGVWIVNPKCVERAKKLNESQITGSYHQLTQMIEMGQKFQTAETPNTLGIYLLGKVAEDMLIRGKKSIINDTIYKASILYSAIENSSMNPFIENKEHRSKTVIVADAGSNTSKFLKDASSRGWIIGSGYGKHKENHIRIANFPTHSKEQIEQLCDFIAKY